MSKAAMYQGLGAGLVSFGSNFGHLMAENARARREASLLGLRRQFQLADREAEWGRQDERDARLRQQALEDEERQRAARLEDLGSELDIRQQAELSDPRTQAELDTARARQGLIGAQTEYYQDRGGLTGTSGSGPFGKLRPDVYTTDSLQKFQDHMAETGQQRWDLLETRTDLRQNQKIEAELSKRAGEIAASLLPAPDPKDVGLLGAADPVQNFIENMPDQAAAYGVTPEDSYGAAFSKIQQGTMSELAGGGQQPDPSIGGGAPGAGLLDAGATGDPGQMPPEQILADAEQAISAGAGPEMVIARMQEAGVPQEMIDQFMRSLTMRNVRRFQGMQ